mmetsp:Transcript_71/g.177  ORF Transcript_71/g.177 Transcript_71/m.177 type:complete len:227 (+) Transcript_71:335-1015(+)
MRKPAPRLLRVPLPLLCQRASERSTKLGGRGITIVFSQRDRRSSLIHRNLSATSISESGKPATATRNPRSLVLDSLKSTQLVNRPVRESICWKVVAAPLVDDLRKVASAPVVKRSFQVPSSIELPARVRHPSNGFSVGLASASLCTSSMLRLRIERSRSFISTSTLAKLSACNGEPDSSSSCAHSSSCCARNSPAESISCSLISSVGVFEPNLWAQERGSLDDRTR